MQSGTLTPASQLAVVWMPWVASVAAAAWAATMWASNCGMALSQ